MSSRDAILGVGASLAAPPAGVLAREAFGAELEQQRDLAHDVGLADIAHVIAAIEAGAVPESAGASLLAGLLELQARAGEIPLDPSLGDIYTNREAWLSSHASGAGWLGVGRARREAITTGYTLFVRRRTLAFVRAFCGVAEALIELASEHATTLMPDYTYLQAGQPTTFAHYLLGFTYPVLRDLARARSFFTRFDRSPAGVGGTNGSALPFDRMRLAELLGFPSVVEHARDAMWQADETIEALAVTCAAIVNLDRLAEDLTIFSTAEFGFIELADAHARASKIMPQKKNPYALTYVRAVANRIIGSAAGVAAAQRTPSGQMDNRLDAYGDVPKAFLDVAGAADLMAAVVRELVFDRAAARAVLDRSASFASDLAELVMTEGGVDYRTAHALVARVCRTMRGGHAVSPDALRDEIETASHEFLGRRLALPREAVARALDPVQAVERRRGIGGAAGSSVATMLVDVRAHLTEAVNWQQQTAARTLDAERRLIEIARETVASR